MGRSLRRHPVADDRERRADPLGPRPSESLVAGDRRAASLIHRATRTLAGALAAVAIACAPPAAVPTASAALPTGGDPLAAGLIAFDSDRGGGYEIFVMRQDGTGARAITNDAALDSWWPRISPDRRAIVFYRTPRGI